MDCKIIRSKRKSLGLELNLEELIVRAPMHVSDTVINSFIVKHETWIKKNLKRLSDKQKTLEELNSLTEDDMEKLSEKALKVIPERVRFYAPKVGVTFGKITIRNQRTRWGSCSQKGNLSFNCLLMLTPPEVIDSVVVHELCHRKQMDHSEKFYKEVLRVYPEYRKWNKWLKENGGILLKGYWPQGDSYI